MKKILKLLLHIDDTIGMAAMAVTVGIIIINVLVRAIFRQSILFAEEVAFIGFGWATFIGAASCYKRKMHIGIDLLVNAFPPKMRDICYVMIDVILLGFNAYFTYLSLQFAVGAYVKPSSILGIPYTYINISAPIAFLIMAVYSVIFLLHDLKMLDDIGFLEGGKSA